MASKSCRLCLQPCEANELLQNRIFREKAQDIFSLLISTSGATDSTAACEACESRVNRFYKFKHRCRQLEELRRYPDKEPASKGFAVKDDGKTPVKAPEPRKAAKKPLKKQTKPSKEESADDDPPPPEPATCDSNEDEKPAKVKEEPVEIEAESAPPTTEGKRKRSSRLRKPPKSPAAKPEEADSDDGLETVEFKVKKTRKAAVKIPRDLVRFTKEQLATHTKNELYRERRNTICEQCGKPVSDVMRESHMNRHLGVRPYTCNEPDCELSFYDAAGLKGHTQRMHENGEFPCKTCGKVFRCKRTQKTHSLIHQEHTLKCEICGLTARTKSRMAFHMRVHTQQRDYKCTYCSKTFYASTVLTLHLRSHTGERPYTCHCCPSAFAHRILYVKHMKKHHPGAEIYMLADMPKLAKAAEAAAASATETVAAEETTETMEEYLVEEVYDEDAEAAYRLEKVEVLEAYRY